MSDISVKKRVAYLILAIISTIGVSYYLLNSTGNIFNVVMLLLFYYLYQKNGFDCSKRQKIFAFSLSVLYSFLLVVGKISKSNKSIVDSLKEYTYSVHKDEFLQESKLSGWQGIPDKIILMVMFIGMLVVLSFLIIWTLKLIESYKSNAIVLSPNKNAAKIFLISFFAILILWLPYFIINYPGILTYDSVNQIQQIEGGCTVTIILWYTLYLCVFSICGAKTVLMIRT